MHPDNIATVGGLDMDYMGFIFYPKSKRFVDENIQKIDFENLPKQIRKTAVFVNESIDNISTILQQFPLDAVQLHGSETPDYCGKLQQKGVRVIKAFAVAEHFDFKVTEAYSEVADFFLFDTPTQGFGGSGEVFNWQILENYNGETPFFLSGGIGMHNIEHALAFQHPKLYGIDLNSRLETQPGLKDPKLVQLIINTIRNYERI